MFFYKQFLQTVILFSFSFFIVLFWEVGIPFLQVVLTLNIAADPSVMSVSVM